MATNIFMRLIIFSTESNNWRDWCRTKGWDYFL